jgi:hypothetical protein
VHYLASQPHLPAQCPGLRCPCRSSRKRTLPKLMFVPTLPRPSNDSSAAWTTGGQHRAHMLLIIYHVHNRPSQTIKNWILSCSGTHQFVHPLYLCSLARHRLFCEIFYRWGECAGWQYRVLPVPAHRDNVEKVMREWTLGRGNRWFNALSSILQQIPWRFSGLRMDLGIKLAVYFPPDPQISPRYECGIWYTIGSCPLEP